jgi:hypothetical protein
MFKILSRDNMHIIKIFEQTSSIIIRRQLQALSNSKKPLDYTVQSKIKSARILKVSHQRKKISDFVPQKKTT